MDDEDHLAESSVHLTKHDVLGIVVSPGGADRFLDGKGVNVGIHDGPDTMA